MTTLETLVAVHGKAAPVMGQLSLLIETKRGLTRSTVEAISEALEEAAKLLRTLIEKE